MSRTRWLFPFVMAGLSLAAEAASQQAAPPAGHDGHGDAALYVARVRGEAGPAESATGTGSFVLEANHDAAELIYGITYDGLPGPPTAVYLRNGQDPDGPVVHVICGRPPGGAEAGPCPPGTGATLMGRWSSGPSEAPLTPDLVREMAAQRIVLEIDGGAEGARLEATLEPNAFMAMAEEFVSVLRGANGATGIAAVRLIRIGEGEEIFQYDVTVTGGGPVREIQLAGGGGRILKSMSGSERAAMRLNVARGALREGAGTLRGVVRNQAGPNLLLLRSDDIRELLSGGNLSVNVVTTSNVTLRGGLQPVR